MSRAIHQGADLGAHPARLAQRLEARLERVELRAQRRLVLVAIGHSASTAMIEALPGAPPAALPGRAPTGRLALETLAVREVRPAHDASAPVRLEVEPHPLGPTPVGSSPAPTRCASPAAVRRRTPTGTPTPSRRTAATEEAPAARRGPPRRSHDGSAATTCARSSAGTAGRCTPAPSRARTPQAVAAAVHQLHRVIQLNRDSARCCNANAAQRPRLAPHDRAAAQVVRCTSSAAASRNQRLAQPRRRLGTQPAVAHAAHRSN